MKKKTIHISFYIPEFLWIKDQYYKGVDTIECIRLLPIWCKLKRNHLWREYGLSELTPHWRKCRRCGERELDHNDGFGTPDWNETCYGTPLWDLIKM